MVCSSDCWTSRDSDAVNLGGGQRFWLSYKFSDAADGLWTIFWGIRSKATGIQHKSVLGTYTLYPGAGGVGILVPCPRWLVRQRLLLTCGSRLNKHSLSWHRPTTLSPVFFTHLYKEALHDIWLCDLQCRPAFQRVLEVAFGNLWNLALLFLH